MRDHMEYWDVYDEKGRKTGRIKAKTRIWLPGEFHLAMEAWILNSNKEILLQRRADSCEVLPGHQGLETAQRLTQYCV